jgi:hypothetical protein
MTPGTELRLIVRDYCLIKMIVYIYLYTASKPAESTIKLDRAPCPLYRLISLCFRKLYTFRIPVHFLPCGYHLDDLIF